jgi:hypothetical protein
MRSGRRFAECACQATRPARRRGAFSGSDDVEPRLSGLRRCGRGRNRPGPARAAFRARIGVIFHRSWATCGSIRETVVVPRQTGVRIESCWSSCGPRMWSSLRAACFGGYADAAKCCKATPECGSTRRAARELAVAARAPRHGKRVSETVEELRETCNPARERLQTC